jgi:hypothetical protein
MWPPGPYSEACFIKPNEEEPEMTTNLTAVIATERQQRYTDDAAAYRRSRGVRRHTRRVGAFLKDLAAASL